MKKISFVLLLALLTVAFYSGNISSSLFDNDLDRPEDLDNHCYPIHDTLHGKDSNPVCPACEYCRYLEYEVDHNTGEVIFPDNTTADHWEFFKGAEGQKWSFCEQQGYRIQTVSEDMGNWMGEYAVCMFDDSTVCLEEHFYLGLCEPGQCKEYSFTNGCCSGDE